MMQTLIFDPDTRVNDFVFSLTQPFTIVNDNDLCNKEMLGCNNWSSYKLKNSKNYTIYNSTEGNYTHYNSTQLDDFFKLANENNEWTKYENFGPKLSFIPFKDVIEDNGIIIHNFTMGLLKP